MNFLQTIGIPVALTLIAVALIWILIGVRGAWAAKLALILLVPFVTFTVWSALDSYLGWPTTDPMPKKALLVWADIREPRPKDNEPGAIFVWAVPMDDKTESSGSFLKYIPAKHVPRSYQMPYDRTLHKELAQAMEGVAKGGSFVINGPDGKDDKGEKNEQEICPVPGSGADRRAQKRIYRLPISRPPKYPNQQ